MDKTKTLLETAQELREEYVREYGREPDCAWCEIKYLDDDTTIEVTISLYDNTPDGWEDDDIFYYTSGIESLCSLAEEGPGEDFVLTNIYEML